MYYIILKMYKIKISSLLNWLIIYKYDPWLIIII